MAACWDIVVPLMLQWTWDSVFPVDIFAYCVPLLSPKSGRRRVGQGSCTWFKVDQGAEQQVHIWFQHVAAKPMTSGLG